MRVRISWSWRYAWFGNMSRDIYILCASFTFLWWCDLVNPCMASFSMPQSSPVANTTLGKVRGLIDYSRLNRQYYKYLGIPYAKPPEGELRFEAPIPFNDKWEGIRATDSWGSPCLQFDAILRGRVLGKEDCLYLNIFTNSVNPAKLYPVMIWIHGGGFVAGSSDMYDPKYMMDYDIVVVSMNYRLASLGFLNTGDELIRGNMGLKDQNLAMRFVQQNIMNFGGDPNRVTLLGESAGSASVHYHVISKLSKGLFHRAIMQSGNIFCPWAHTRSPGKQAMRFGKAIDCPVENTTVLVECLKRMDGRRIVKEHASILSPVHTQDDFFPGSVEAVVREDTFLSENPFMVIKRGDFNKVPVIFGMNSGEGALKTARLEATPEVINALDIKWDDHISVLLHYNPEMKNISDKLRHFYCPESIGFPIASNNSSTGSNNSTVGEGGENCQPEEEDTPKNSTIIPPQEALENVTQMISDGVWFHATKEAAIHHAKYAPVYLNYFSYHSTVLPSTYTFIKSARVRNNVPAEFTWPRYFAEAYIHQLFFQRRNPKRFGACHGDDLMYYWSTNPILQIRPFSQDYTFSVRFVKFIVDFMRGSPQMTFGDVEWEPVEDMKKPRYMKLDRNPEMIDQPFGERMDFIHSLDIRDPMDPNNW